VWTLHCVARQQVCPCCLPDGGCHLCPSCEHLRPVTSCYRLRALRLVLAGSRLQGLAWQQRVRHMRIVNMYQRG
jgi:hypothetical protein